MTTIFLEQSEIKAEELPIVESAINLWAILPTPAESGQPADEPGLEPDFVLKGLVHCADSKVRGCLKAKLSEMGRAQKSMLDQIVRLLVRQLESMQDAENARTREFFALLQELVIHYFSPDSFASGSEELTETVLNSFDAAIRLLKAHQSSETRSSVLSDHTLHGLLELLASTLQGARQHASLRSAVLAKVNHGELIQEVFFSCLFTREGVTSDGPESQDGRPKESKCVLSGTRKSGFKVLREYVAYLEPKEMLEFIQTYVMPLLAEVERPKKWRHLPSSKGRVGKHVGIVNLGCICYMISMLQQFFMVPQFRYQLLRAVDPSPEDLQEYKGDRIDDNLLRQLQRLFGQLELSERHAADPKALCFSYKDYDGTPIKTGEQKDSQEFLNIFFERLETLLKPTSQRELLKDVFAGNLCSQLICQSCGKVRNKTELFYNLSLQVKGCSGIHNSLSEMVKGQTIEDYWCEGCNQKVNVVKRSLLADMPNVLIVHLQRIVFCFDTLQNDKVNSRFEFPNVLDLKAYSFKEVMKESDEEDLQELKQVEDDAYLYRLVGVNVHVGTADHGHYYSLINTRRGKDEPVGESDEATWKKVENDPWKVFDDASVRTFAFSRDLKPEAFGGDLES